MLSAQSMLSLRRLLKITLLTVVGTFLALYVGIVVLLSLYQDRLVFPAPTGYPNLTPASIGLPFENLHIPVNKTEQIHAWYIPSTTASQKVVLYFHGNAYTIEDAVSGEVRDLHETGASLLVVDYRGYGGSSPGQANGVRACEDARAALGYLTEQRHVRAEDIVIIGRSIGTGVAAQLALENPRAAGLVLMSPFTNLYAVARENKAMRWLPLELMGTRNRLDTLRVIAKLRMPILLAVGTQDNLTPPWMAEQLFKQANPPKQLYLVPGAEHNDLWGMGRHILVTKIASFVNNGMTRPAEPSGTSQ
jgi:uncharacterized protein